MLESLLKAKVLIVDDDPTNVKIVERHLEQAGYKNLSATTDPEVALEMFTEESFDLVLLDLKMPKLNGRDVAKKLRQLKPNDLVPIIVLSAVSQKDIIRYMLDEGGAQDYLTKPFDGRELLARVRNLLEVRLMKQTLEERVKARTLELQLANTSLQKAWSALVIALGRAGEYRDEETGAHTVRIGLMAAELARSLGWCETQIEILRLTAPLHDIGKVGIPDAILLKPDRLTESELVVMHQHAFIGSKILLSAPDASESQLIMQAAAIARNHHEKWDGTGYPSGIAGEEIPLAARVVAVVDVFDALLSTRPYKKAWTTAKAVAYIQSESGKQFDPRLVAVFTQCLPRLIEIRAGHADPVQDNSEERR